MKTLNLSEAAPKTKHEVKSAATRKRICNAVVRCLDLYGYAETTLVKIEQEAQMSRGALMHHFQSRNEMVAATALMLLEQSLKPIGDRADLTRFDHQNFVRDLIIESWERIVNTSGGRALLEILMACRTDPNLKSSLSGTLNDWDRSSLSSVSSLLVSRGGDPDELELIWSIWRCFLRGVIVHEQFISDPQFTHRMVLRFGEMVEGYLTQIGS